MKENERLERIQLATDNFPDMPPLAVIRAFRIVDEMVQYCEKILARKATHRRLPYLLRQIDQSSELLAAYEMAEEIEVSIDRGVRSPVQLTVSFLRDGSTCNNLVATFQHFGHMGSIKLQRGNLERVAPLVQSPQITKQPRENLLD